MMLDKFKGNEAFRVIGKCITILKSLYDNEKTMEIVKEGMKSNNKKWTLDFLEASLTETPEKWMDLFLLLNPDSKADEVSTMDVFAFAYEFLNDPIMMNLFFSQSRQNVSISSGSAMANTKEIGKK